MLGCMTLKICTVGSTVTATTAIVAVTVAAETFAILFCAVFLFLFFELVVVWSQFVCIDYISQAIINMF